MFCENRSLAVNVRLYKAEDFYQGIQREIREYGDYPMREGQRVGTVAFRDFVRYIQNGHDRDPHWNVQTQRLMLDLISYDFIGRYETFADDFATVMDRFDAPEDVRAMAFTLCGRTYKIPLAVAYDSDLAGVVYDIYREDFETFDYDRDSWMFEGE